ncbi:type II secretion system F family protein [Cellulomonas fimi]|uniref:Type II secretion system F domain protein n=1 Tax=Cellulomonas fimi (strain ATCC 484 / DSM 20113 / JCM 1341 / CCUG 24087 / LMG 16345 / NBRC 15513 / NCIMB 8980 / NCTC 7547 / NRS-133) TaxID=590998 RepID=F4H056_CELFA|nr:type II secretion system F domain-containing protein [Cellulomonas fimi]AEE44978.1 Type II secretion system F domain protein [Cellulomonas fimi ATCC 484]
MAARVRSGEVPGAAWSAVLGVPVPSNAPTVDQLLGGAGRTSPGAAGRAAAAVAAGRLAAELGAPLADVLEQVARAVAADEEHETEVAAALAGPRATTRVLTLLPVAGVLLGMLLGANPVGVVLDGGLGTASAALGVVLLLGGRAWTGRLTARTARAGRLGPGS